MRVYRLNAGGLVPPFDDRARDCLIGNQTLSALQERAFARLTDHPIIDVDEIPSGDGDEYVVLPDRYYITEKLAREFVMRSRALRRSTVCGLVKSALTKSTSVNTQSVRQYADYIEFDLRYEPRSGHRGAPQLVVVDPPFARLPVRLPDHVAGPAGHLVVSSEYAIISVEHWANLWCANLAEVWSYHAHLTNLSKRELLPLAIKQILRPKRAIDAASSIGKGAMIHPTAVVEASTIGAGASIAPRSVVLLSTIGEGAYVGSGAVVEASVVGSGSFVASGAVLSRAVLYPGAVVNTRFMHASMMGRDTFAAGQVAFCDVRFDGRTVHVQVGGAMVDTQLHALGGCLGHRVYLGSGAVLNPGCAIPNDRRVILDEQRVINRWDGSAELPGYRVKTRGGRRPDGDAKEPPSR